MPEDGHFINRKVCVRISFISQITENIQTSERSAKKYNKVPLLTYFKSFFQSCAKMNGFTVIISNDSFKF